MVEEDERTNTEDQGFDSGHASEASDDDDSEDESDDDSDSDVDSSFDDRDAVQGSQRSKRASKSGFEVVPASQSGW